MLIAVRQLQLVQAHQRAACRTDGVRGMQHDRAAGFDPLGGLTHLHRHRLSSQVVVALLFASSDLTTLLLAIEENLRLVTVAGIATCSGLAAFKAFALLLQFACLALTRKLQALQGNFRLGACCAFTLGIDTVITTVAIKAQA
ncbi:hypothetical protein D3C81_1498390 [compost metagenome]